MGFLNSVIADAKSSSSVREPSARSRPLSDAAGFPLRSDNANSRGMEAPPVQSKTPFSTLSAAGAEMRSKGPEGGSTLTNKPAPIEESSNSVLSAGSVSGDDTVTRELVSHDEKRAPTAQVSTEIDLLSEPEYRTINARIDVREVISVSQDNSPGEVEVKDKGSSGYQSLTVENIRERLSTEEKLDEVISISDSVAPPSPDVIISEHNDETPLREEIIDRSPRVEERGESEEFIEDSPLLSTPVKPVVPAKERHSISLEGAEDKHIQYPGEDVALKAKAESFQPSKLSRVFQSDQSPIQKSDDPDDSRDQPKRVIRNSPDIQPRPTLSEQRPSVAVSEKPHREEKTEEVEVSKALISKTQPAVVKPQVILSEPVSHGGVRHAEKSPGRIFIESPGGPEVRIGQVDVFIEGPRRQEGRRTSQSRPSPSMSSRNYLRRL